jgi:dihydrolipoamide dehydrogenase
MDVQKTQLAVIGGGPGGYGAAFMAADLGMEVTLIDVEKNPGGTCLYRGCIPSKALLHVAKLMSSAREAAHWGLTYAEPEMDLDKMRESTNAVVEQMTKGLGQLSKARKINYVQGMASFIDPQNLEIYRAQERSQIQAETTIIATGSRPQLFGPLIDSPRIMNSTSALQLADIPKTLLVIGGGYIGLELGTVYATLGSKVTLAELTGGLLPGTDPELVKPLQQRLEKLFSELYLNTKVQEMKEVKGGIKVRLEGDAVKKPERIFDKVLVCVGRRPNASGLNLKTTGVKVNDKGFIETNTACRTSDPNILAIGDVAGGLMLAHKATHEGRVAAEVAAGQNVVFEPQAIPAVVFTDPEIAYCGLQPEQAKAQGRDVKVVRFPWAASGRATTLNRNEGLTKLIIDPGTEQVLGVGIVGEHAGELIAEGTLAVEMGATAKDIDLTIHAHPTLTETLMESAASLYGQATHIYRPARKQASSE